MIEDSLLKSDIFFFITTLCVVMLSIIFSVLMIYFIRIIRDIAFLVKTARKGGGAFLDGVKEAKEKLKGKLGAFASILLALFAFKVSKKTSKKNNK